MTDGELDIQQNAIERNDNKASLYALAVIIDDLKNDDTQVIMIK